MDYAEWIDELEREHKAHRDFREQARKVEKRYRLEEKTKYNILWANTEILQSALYSSTPKPDVRRRHKEPDQVAKTAAEVLERGLEYSIDQYDFDGVIAKAVNNSLVPAMGQVRVNYTPFFSTTEVREDLDVIEDEEGGRKFFSGDKEVEGQSDDTGAFRMVEEEEKVFEEVSSSVVPWSRFRWSPAKDWETVWWVAEEHFLTEEQVERTFVIGREDTIPLGYKADGGEADKTAKDGALAKVVEVWDKRHREHFGIILGMQRALKFRAGDSEADDDPLNLKGFWPYPEPLASNVHAGKWMPIPDYLFYQDQAMELDELTRRIEALTQELKWRGVYDAAFETLQNVLNGDDGTFKGVENFAERFGKTGAGLESVMAHMPLGDLKKTIQWLLEAREQVKQTIFEITGISDIVRGASKASETLGAQQLKGQFANMRLSTRQKRVQMFVREIMRIKAEIISEHYSPETLTMMTGLPVDQSVMQVLQSDVLRNFSVDIETDSTILFDMAEEQQNRTQVLEAVTALVSAWAPLMQMNPGIMDVVKELVMFQLGAFKSGKHLEEVFERLSNNTTPDVDSLAGGAVGQPAPAAGDNVSALRGQ